MANVRDLYTGDGTTVLFSLSFEYLDQEDVKATINGVPTTAFGFVNASTIQFASAPANGADIVLFRETPVDEAKAVFFAGSPIRAIDLNQNNTQVLYASQENVQGTGEANATANLALTNSNTAISTANAAVVTANAADAAAAAAVITSNTAESNSLAAVSTANTASSNASAAVITANAASSAASSAVSTANAASSTANQAAIDAAAAIVTANAADGKADAAVLTANAADANALAAVATANQASIDATSAGVQAANAENNSVLAVGTANAAIAAVASAVLYQPVADLAALALLTPLDGEFFELNDSTGADTDPSITGVPVGLVGSAGLTFRLRYDDPPGEYVFLGYFANDSETRYLKTGTGTVTSTNILDGTIVDADINASAAIAGTKISPDFGSQALTTTGLISANGKVSFPLGTAGAPSLFPGTDTNTGIYSPGADQVAISTNGTGRLFVNSSGQVGVGGTPLSTFQVVGPSTTANTGATILVDSSAAFAIDVGGSIAFRGDSDASTAARTFGLIRGGKSNSISGNFSGYLAFETRTTGLSNTTERLRITSTGNVGIGTTGPNESLEVAGNIHVSGADRSIFNRSNNALTFGTNNAERARIDSSGRLLVGTSSSSSAAGVVIQGSSGSTDGILRLASDNATPANGEAIGVLAFGANNHSNSARIVTRRDGGTWTSGTSEPARLEFSTTADGASSPTVRMRIDNAGNVGIAVAPTSLLHLRGTGDVLRLDTSGSEDQNGVSLRFHQRDTTIVNNQGYGGLEWEGSDSSNAGVRGYIKGFAEGTTGEFGLRFATQGSGASSPVEQARLTSTGDLAFNSGYGAVATAYGCRAWVNFDGTTSPGTIRASGNVSSVTRNGTGDYTVNFATAMPDANYASNGTSGSEATDVRLSTSSAPTASSFRFTIRNINSGNNTNATYVSVAIFR